MTLFGHAALGATVYGALRPHEETTRWGLSRRALLWLCLLLPMLPDADVIMHKWVKYGHVLGHRGVSHSFAFALIVSLLVAWWLQRRGRALPGRQVFARMTLAFFLLLGSHAVTDTMTTGGKAPLLFWPLEAEGVRFPKRFIPVSPMGRSLIQTKWSKKQLANARKRRTRHLRGKDKPFMLVRKVVELSEREDHYRRLGLLGIVITEFILLTPLALLALFVYIYRRRKYGPAAKEPPRIRPPPEAPPEGPPPRTWPAAALTGLGLIVALVGASMVRAPDADIQVHDGHFDDELQTAYRYAAPQDVSDEAPVAVLVHGARCSHQMMTSLARTLARNGVEVWAVDMPGHGSSPIPLETGCEGKKMTCGYSNNRLFLRSTAKILEHLYETEGLADRQVVLIGHSTGAVVAHELGGKLGEQLAGRVVLEGRFRKLKRGGNRLIVGKTKYLKKGGGKVKRGVVHGDFEDRSAYMLYKAQIPHLEMIHNAHVNKGVLRWVADATGKPVGQEAEPHRDLHTRWPLALGFFGLTLSLLGATLATQRGWLPPVRPVGHPRPWLAILCMVFGSIAAVLWAGELFRSGQPWLQAKIGQVMPVYLMCAGACIGLPYLAISRRPGIPELRSVVTDVSFGVLVFASIYLTVGLATDAYFFHVGLSPSRVWRFLGWSIAFLPVALLVQEVGFEGEHWRTRLGNVLVHACLWGAILWIEGLSRGNSQVADAKRLLAVVLIAEIWVLVPGWRRNSRLHAAIVTAMVLAWIQASTYPVLTGAPLG